MEPNQNPQHENVLPLTAEFGNVPNDAERFRTVPNAAETFGNERNHSERFGSVPHASERKESHSLTVREAARLFEAAGVARTERSITNWCQPNRTGVARLDAYFDPNERKYYISPQSVETAIAEEKAKAAKNNQPAEPAGPDVRGSEPFRSHPQDSETGSKAKSFSENVNFRDKELEREIQNLRITNQVKDLFIEQLKNEQTHFMDQLLAATHKVGVLETKLLQIQSPVDAQIGVEK